MTILAIRTDSPEAELGLYKDNEKLVYIKWIAHRQLADTIHTKLQQILDKSSIQLGDLDGIVIYKGPGSFTGLRIGASVANTLAYSLIIPIVSTAGEKWAEQGIEELLSGKDQKIVVPEYGAEANVTKPRK